MRFLCPTDLWCRLTWRDRLPSLQRGVSGDRPHGRAVTRATGNLIQAMAAGNDLLMIKNVFNFDPSLPQNIVRWVREAIERGVLLEKISLNWRITFAG